MTKRGLSCALLLLGLAICAIAQEQKPAEEKPSVDQILQKMVDAAGGKAVIEKMTTRNYKGTFELPSMGASGTWERFEKAPNKLLSVTEIAGFGTMTEVCDGQTAWSDNPMAGFTEKTGATLARAKLDADFYHELRMKELYPKMTVLGKEKVGTMDAWVVEATPAEGSPDKLYFDCENGLLVRQEGEREGPQGSARIVTFLEDYKDIDGYKVPQTMRMEIGELGIVLKITDFKTNVEIDDAKFERPKPKPEPTPEAKPEAKPPVR